MDVAGKKVGLPALLSPIIPKLLYHILEAHVSFPQYILLRQNSCCSSVCSLSRLSPGEIRCSSESRPESVHKIQ